MGLFGGGGDDINVSIGGDSSGLQGATSSAANATEDMATRMANAIKQASDAYDNMSATVRYTTQAHSILGDTVTQSNLSWLNAASSADDYRNRLGYLQSQLGYFTLMQGGAKGGVDDFNLSLTSMLPQLGTWIIVSNQLMGLFQTIISPIEQAGQAVLQFGEMLGQVAIDGVQALADQIENLGQQMFDLNNQTEKNVYSWSYTYGQGMSRPAAISQADQMAAWTGQFSMNIPFTRQDLMTAVSGAALLGNSAQIEQYMPMIADLAATHVNPMTGQPVSLGEAVQAIRGEKMGLSRMLKYQLGINPEDLIKYGLDATATSTGVHINNPDTLLPALQKYSEANGWTNYQNGQDQGAAYTTSRATFWGAQSSFEDRIQNWLLRAGGMDMSGNVGKGSFFGSLKDDLNGISDWIDKHQADLNHVADLIGNVFAGGVKLASDAVEGLAAGLHASGLDTLLEGLVGQLGQWMNDPNTQKSLQAFGQTFGQIAGSIGSGGIESGIKLFQGFFSSLQQSGIGDQIETALKGLGTWLSDPTNQQTLEHFGEMFGQIAGAGLSDAVSAIKNIAGGVAEFMKNMTPQEMGDIVAFFKILFLGFQNLGTVIGDMIPIFGDFGRVISDLIHGNFGDLGAAITQTNTDSKKLLTDLATNFTNTVTSIADQSFTWGADFTENFALGMYSKQADVQRAANEQAKLVAQYLHHSTPELGPLAGDDVWGAELVQQFADSMTLAAPRLQQAALLVAQHAAGAYPFGGYGGPGGYRPGAGANSSYSTAYTTNYGDTGVTLNLYGASAAQVLAIVAQAQAAQGQQAHLLALAPGLAGPLAGGVGVLGAFGA